MQRKGADRPVAENEAGTDARIGKSLERERGGLEGEGEAFLQKGSPPPPQFFPLLDYMKISLYKTIRSS